MSELPLPASENSLPWVRRPWCVQLALTLVILGAILNCIYLWNHCPLDLSEDESHYWEWSRHLDYGYYSKPFGIAWVIKAATLVGAWCGMPQATMPVVRMPAVLFSVGSGLMTIWLARRVFRDDRAGLMAAVMGASVPVFGVGSLLITIDSPMYFFWCATVCCLWCYVDPTEDRAGRTKWLYLAALACGCGMLFKPVLIAIPLTFFVMPFVQSTFRNAFRTRHAVAALLLFFLFQIPLIVWNANYHWVTFRHIFTQGGLVLTKTPNGVTTATQNSIIATTQVALPPLSVGNVLLQALLRAGEYVGSQIGLLAGIMAVLLVVAVIQSQNAIRSSDTHRSRRVGLAFLLWFSLPLWLFYFVLSFRTKAEPNWPAASYFAWMVLLAGIATAGWNSAFAKERRAWKQWIITAAVWGITLLIIGENFQLAYPMIAKGPFDNYLPRLKLDPAYRLRGLAGRGAAVDTVVDEMTRATGRRPLVIAGAYDLASSLAFHLRGQPFVYCIGRWLGRRMTQYDLWPGLDAKNPDGTWQHAGENAVMVGTWGDGLDTLRAMFDRIEEPQRLPVSENGVVIRMVVVVKCYGFHGMPTPPPATY